MKTFQIGNRHFQWNRSGRCYTLALLTQKATGDILKRSARILRLSIAPGGRIRVEWHQRTQTLQKRSSYGQ
ncbi:hypothetical protein LL912_10025 [Niabella sp. CC-SYL272]|uniref:hypothetical protein n=1 Tax=Niabella agricola TaxID=2891571 RepID=UPI001F3BA775|nr:hypothetical protein [Niabella agricola]MCF3109114.1 hypothetical protein [Niabella agricola]